MPQDKLFQNVVYVGNTLQDFLYGIELILYFRTIHILLCRRPQRGRSVIFYACFSSMMFFLITVWVVNHIIFGERVWVENQAYPGGPAEYWEVHMSDWYMGFGGTAVIALQLITDALVINRCRIVWNSYRVIIVPSVLWMATLGLGIIVDWSTAAPGTNLFAGLASIYALSYYTISALLNSSVTCIICYRMVSHGMRVKKQLGQEYAHTYFNVVSIIIESVLPYSLSGVAFLISLGIGSSTSIAFYSVYVMLMCISPQMLILRVIMGRVWNEDSGRPQGTTVKFSPGDTISTSRTVEESAEAVHVQSIVYPPDSDSELRRYYDERDFQQIYEYNEAVGRGTRRVRVERIPQTEASKLTLTRWRLSFKLQGHWIHSLGSCQQGNRFRNFDKNNLKHDKSAHPASALTHLLCVGNHLGPKGLLPLHMPNPSSPIGVTSVERGERACVLLFPPSSIAGAIYDVRSIQDRRGCTPIYGNGIQYRRQGQLSSP
ncbi:hypothetical protein BU15DRAFT_64814 [Melanogaster broomeanus]|nr:hypothetical protein BU15DRAFT_64814 [Melanogaster broomeanus]